MGSRGSIILMPPGSEPDISKFIDNPEAIILYTHWGGSEIPSTLQESIKHLGVEAAKHPKTLLVDLLGRDFKVADHLEYSYPPLMVSPDRGMIYFDADPAEYHWADWTFEDFVKLSGKNLATLQDASQKEQWERVQGERELTESIKTARKNEYLATLAASSIPIGIAGALGIYLKSKNQLQ